MEAGATSYTAQECQSRELADAIQAAMVVLNAGA